MKTTRTTALLIAASLGLAGCTTDEVEFTNALIAGAAGIAIASNSNNYHRPAPIRVQPTPRYVPEYNGSYSDGSGSLCIPGTREVYNGVSSCSMRGTR